MMRRLLLLFVLSSFLLHLLGQQEVYFDKRIDHYNNYDYSRNIILTDSGYMIGGFTEDTAYLYNVHLSFTKLNIKGEITLFKEFGHDSINMFLGNPGSLMQYSGNKFFTVGTKRLFTADWVHDQGMLGCYNSSFDTLWTQYFGEKTMPFDTAFLLYQIKKTQDGNLIMTGIRLPIEDPSSIWLMETDSLGNKLWETFIGGDDDYYYQGHSLVQTADGGYAIGAVKFKIESTGGSMDPLIIKTDSLGNEEWRINPGNPDVADNKVMVALAADGNIIAGTNYGTQSSGDNQWMVVKIMKVTPSGEVLWDNDYGEPGYDKFLANTIVLANGNIIANGGETKFDIGPDRISWILCVDSVGNELWYKEYALLEGDYSNNRLYDIKQASDGGLVGCGMVSPVVPDTGTVDIWVMKMDSMGCLEPGCDSTVGVAVNPLTGSSFALYPNPTRNEITVELAAGAERDILFAIYDMYGTKTKEVAIRQQARTKRINVSGLPQGVYLGVLTVNGQPLGSGKFIIER